MSGVVPSFSGVGPSFSVVGSSFSGFGPSFFLGVWPFLLGGWPGTYFCQLALLSGPRQEANDFDVKCVTCSRSSAVVTDLVTALFATNDARIMHNTSPNITSTSHRKCQVIAVTSCAVVVVVLMCGFMRECVAWHAAKLACRNPKRLRDQHVPDSPLPSRYMLKVVHLKLSPRKLDHSSAQTPTQKRSDVFQQMVASKYWHFSQPQLPTL